MNSIFLLEGENITFAKANLLQKSGNNLHAGSILCCQEIEPRLLKRSRKGLESKKNFLIA